MLILKPKPESSSGHSLFSRYMNLPDKTAAEFSGAFFKTGDIAARERVGDDGVYYKILGRASMVVSHIARACLC